MDLARVHEIPASDAQKLQDAGIGSAATLAAVTDVDDLAQRAGLPAEAVDAHRAAARSAVERLLADAGISSEEQLASAEPRQLATATGLSLSEVEAFQRAARKLVAPPEPAHPSGEDRVVLVDGSSRALVRVGNETVQDVPLLTGRFEEDAPAALEKAGEHGVFLLPGSATATVRVRGHTHAGFPIYKGETRVRVKDVREKGAAPPPAAPADAPASEEPKKGGLRGLFGRKKA